MTCLRRALLLLAALAAVVACFAVARLVLDALKNDRGTSTPRTAAMTEAPGAEGSTSHCRPGEARLGSNQIAYVALVRSEATIYRGSGYRSARVARLERLNANGVVNALGVLAEVRGSDCRALWYRVQLPLPPNGSSGYVRASEVKIALVRTRIVVELSERRLTLFESGRRVMRARIGVGAAATPTPTGRFYVDQRFRLSDPSGPFGSAALGLAAYSETLRGWPQGAPIALHGTNDPVSIGGSASHGCIRLDEHDLERLFALVSVGTPVRIVA